MNRSIFWRVFWKEYRLQRAIWIAMAVLTVLLMLLVVAFIVPRTDLDGSSWICRRCCRLLLRLGCGADVVCRRTRGRNLRVSADAARSSADRCLRPRSPLPC